MKRSVSKRRGHRSHKRRMSRGGDSGVAPYTSASSYANWMVGSENDQYGRVFNQGGPNNSQSNAIMANENSGTLGYLPYQRAGKRMSRRSRKGKKGGFLGSMVNQAVVPFGLVGLNQYYGKRRFTSKTRKVRKY